MVNSTIISKVFIGENEIKSILDKLKLNYEYGHNNEFLVFFRYRKSY